MKSLINSFVFAIMLFVLAPQNTFSQNDSKKGVKYIQKLINADSLLKAQAELHKQIAYFKSVKQYDSLINYYDLVGSKTLANNDNNLALERTKHFTNELLEYNNPNISVLAKIGLAGIYHQTDNLKKAYNIALEAYPFLKRVNTKKDVLLAELEYDLGYYALQSSNYPLAKSHFTKTLKALRKADTLDYVSLQRTYNTLGIVNWSQSQMDSTKYYMEKSLDALNKSPKGNDFMNEYYRPALLKANLAIVSQAIGKNYEAISFTENAIKNYQSFLDNSIDEVRKVNAKKSQLAAIDNLGVFYAEIGEFQKAEELINYSYSIKRKLFDASDSNVIISKIILAQAKINNQDLEASAQLLDEAIDSIENGVNGQLYWKGVAYITRASVYDKLGDVKNAIKYYNLGYQINKQVTGNTFSKETLIELGKMAVFFAKQGKDEQALAIAKEVYGYTKKTGFKNSLQDFHSTTNLAETYYHLNKFEEAKNISSEALNLKIETETHKNKISNSIVLQFEKPRAITINCKSKYELEPNKTESFLLDLLQQVEVGIAILDQRKTVIKSHSDLSYLIHTNTELFNLAKQIRLDLYHLTNNLEYIESLVVSHEAGMYSRIRSRLNIREQIEFSDIPSKVLAREQKLKRNITTALQAENEETINTFIQASNTWNTFLDSLKTDYPKYYKMRYATIEKSLDGLKNSIPKNTTVVRYLFVDDDLYAFVCNSKTSTFHKLDTNQLSYQIEQLTQSIFDSENAKKTLNKLYNQLWKPLENDITTKKIIIIPDQELFNLSFETLTPTPISSFSDLATSCLLSKYIISYNYSLYLLNENPQKLHYSNNFVAFAPEFSDQMKNDYKISISDSLSIDKTYLKLLPQPFTKDLAEWSSQLFNGESFLNEKSTEPVFKNSAKEHKIIHIGTHAESNNISPELSRLVFAKSLDSTISDDNYLYTYEIYNTNLSSNLAILTACETGKPTYQSGEGMISLAHAFNYAGSESMLTSLWKIDEQSSAKIIENFYGYLKSGLAKDEALQLAKLDYLKTAKGRTINPEYWAGLVLIGNTSPIDINSTNPTVFWLIGIIIIILLFLFMMRKRIK